MEDIVQDIFANFGLFYKGFPANKLSYIPPLNSGFFYTDEARDLTGISSARHGALVLLARSNDSLMIFEKTK